MPRNTYLRQLRRARELSLDQLSLDTGIADSRLSRAERGLLALTDAQLTTLAKYFRVPKDKLLREAVVRAEVA